MENKNNSKENKEEEKRYKEIIEKATRAYKDHQNSFGKTPINLTEEELKNLIIGLSLEEYAILLDNSELILDNCTGEELEEYIVSRKEELEYWDELGGLLDDTIKQTDEHIADILKQDYLLEGKEIDYFDTNLVHIDLEELFKLKHGMNYNEYALKGIEKMEKELRRSV